MTAKEFIESKYPYTIVDALVFEDLELEDILKEFAKLKCQEQRKICAENAMVNKQGQSPMYVQVLSAPDTIYADIEFQVDKDSVINSPQPEM